MANARAAVADALRPMAVVSAPSVANAGDTVEVTGAASLGANDRTIVSYEWTLVGGATSLTASTGSQTSFVAPGTDGEIVLRLTVTDDQGRSDTTDATIRVVNGSPEPPPAPPPAPSPAPPITVPDPFSTRQGGGGGGRVDGPLLALLLALAACARRKPIAR
jgi:hypothetical protein